MSWEHLLLLILIAAGLTPLVALRNRRRVTARSAVGITIATTLGVPSLLAWAALSFSGDEPRNESVTNRPAEIGRDGYVASSSCRSCHPHQHATWHDSYHRTMTQVATADTLMAPVSQWQQFGDIAFQLQTQGDQVVAEMKVPVAIAGSREMQTSRRPIVLTTGSHHMQILWYPRRDDSPVLGMFPFVFLKEQQRWIPRGAAFLQPHFSLEDELGRWSQTCIACHATHGRMMPLSQISTVEGELYWDPTSAKPEVAEFGISCEACHGPGQIHTQQNQDPLYRYQQHLAHDGGDDIVNPSRLPHERQSEVCGQCHSVQCLTQVESWWTKGFEYRPGDDLHQSSERFVFRVSDREERRHQEFLADHPDFVQDHFWSDGMVRISGREYNGLIESPCYQRGQLSCMSCHQMHQSADDTRSTTDWSDDQLAADAVQHHACTQCHPAFLDPDSLVAHTHHAANSTGSDCYNCHMPHTTYGLLKAIRSHQIDTPTVQASLTTGRPNACNLCHLDRTLEWTSEHLHQWYGQTQPDLSEDERSIAASILWAMRGDAGQRALMAWSFGWPVAQQASSIDWLPPFLTQLLNDPYPAVRLIAERSLRSVAPYETLRYDFLSEPNQRAPAMRQALTIWQSTIRKHNPQVLIDPSGNLMTGEFRRLLKARDDRPIVLVE